MQWIVLHVAISLSIHKLWRELRRHRQQLMSKLRAPRYRYSPFEESGIGRKCN
jgi:hypothetical protein